MRTPDRRRSAHGRFVMLAGLSVGLAAALSLAGCQPPAAPLAGRGEAGATAGGSDMGSAGGLERAAIASGVVADASHISPVGLFSRRHEAGRDSLCLIPDPRQQRHFTFGIETIFGSDEYCRGHGTARRAGDKLILQFSGGARCIVVAGYEGDRVALPGVTDMKCADLCAGRGTLEGVAFPRIASDAATASAARDRDGAPLCE